jgi:hypothetical protein
MSKNSKKLVSSPKITMKNSRMNESKIIYLDFSG